MFNIYWSSHTQIAHRLALTSLLYRANFRQICQRHAFPSNTCAHEPLFTQQPFHSPHIEYLLKKKTQPPIGTYLLSLFIFYYYFRCHCQILCIFTLHNLNAPKKKITHIDSSPTKKNQTQAAHKLSEVRIYKHIYI